MSSPMPHPTWCDRGHGEVLLHSAQVGVDLELTEDLAYAVFVQQIPGEPAEVHLMRHTDEETAFTRFSILEASILRDLLSKGLGLVAAEVSHCPIHPGQSAIDCGHCRAERPGGTP